MISHRNLDELVALAADSHSPVLSVYLDVDQGNSANLNRGFETALKGLLQGIEQGLSNEEAADFRTDSERVRSLVSQYQPSADGLAIFCDSRRDLIRHWELQVPTTNLARWQSTLYLRPLLEARDEYQRYGVIVTDRAQSRLLTFFQGEIEEHRSAFAEADVHRFDGAGSDQILSQTAFQRRSDEHARQHLRQVSQTMTRLWEAQQFDRLILAGTTEAVAELRGLLPAALERALVGTTHLPIDASEDSIRETTELLHESAERQEEESLVEALITAAAKQQQAVTGLEPLLNAVWENRVRSIVYAEGYQPPGGRCLACRRLFGSGRPCPSCGEPAEEVPDLLDDILERVVSSGGEAEQVRAGAAARLNHDGESIGAFLRF